MIFLNLYSLSDIPNEIPDKKKKDEWKIHDTGCARTEGYYKVDSKQKTNFKVIVNFNNIIVLSNVYY